MEEQKYSKEAQRKWGNTDAYKQSVSKTANYGKTNWESINQKASLINSKLANNIDKRVDDSAVQQLVSDWQNHITQYYYNYTPYTLQRLGEMYVADEHFKVHYEKIKPGLSEFFSEATEYYCDNIIK